MNLQVCKKYFALKHVSYVLCLIVPLALLPLAVSPYQESKCAYILLWMAVYWMLEPVHFAVTALLPVPLMPLFGILTGDEVCANYMKEVLMMFLGGLAVAVAVEFSKLHERIALKVLLVLGSNVKWLLLGFMSTTMFLSMWISNTATSAMMVPIVDAVILELEKTFDCNEFAHTRKANKKLKRLRKTLLLSIAWSANCGGTGTITGTSPNMIFKGIFDQLHPGSTEVTYATWMMYNIPGMLLCVLTGWIVLQVLYVPFWQKEDQSMKEKIRTVITKRYAELGSIKFHELAVLFLFIVLVFLWIFREPRFMPGWTSMISTETHIGNAVPVIGILYLLFVIPAEPKKWPNSTPLLTWEAVQEKMPWGMIILLGGGFALADGTQKSGLSDWFGAQMTSLTVLSSISVLVILCVLATVLTEIMSNSTVATILLPVVSKMAVEFEVNPLYLMLPVTICSSYSFMLPVASGSNAIVFDTGHMTIMDMVKPGILMNVCTCLVQIFMINTLGVAAFDLNTFPDWANQTLHPIVNK